jgi:peptide/nickel transport system ATP-binding protein
MSAPVLEIEGLGVAYGSVEAVKDVSLTLAPGEVVGLVGESGSGKSTLIQGLLRTLPPPAVITAGQVRLKGQDVLAMDGPALRALRWRDVALVPQNALNALNPMLTVGDHFEDTLRAHGVRDTAELRRRAVEGMARVDMAPEQLRAYPHMLSGGMRQRVAIALALVLDPALVIFDEPTTALDVVVERDILDRVRALQAERGFAALFITHDVSLLLTFAHRIAVMYSGRLVELGPSAEIGRGGRHPYTQGLIGAMPPVLGEDRVARPIPGAPPRAGEALPGCRFAPRCSHVTAACTAAEPALQTVGAGHTVACHAVTP